MVMRTLLFLGAAICCFNVNALGLGEIKVASALNEPFKATIELTGADSNLNESELLVGLANEATFQRMGIAREAVVLQLKFKPQLKAAPPAILVTSDKPIREPSLDFVLELQSPKGQMMKEYTVLLNPEHN